MPPRIKTGGPPKKKAKLDPRSVAKALAANPKGIDSALLLNCLIERWGGPIKFAAAIHGEFEGARPGSMIRAKILEMVSRLTIVVTSQELAKPPRAADLSDEDLADAASSLLRRMGSTDGPAAATAAETE